MSDTIRTLHPQGKAGVSIDRLKYDTVRSAILGALERSPGLPFWDLVEAVRDQIGAEFDGVVHHDRQARPRSARRDRARAEVLSSTPAPHRHLSAESNAPRLR